MKRRANRDRSHTTSHDQLPDGIGGTITGGPADPIDLLEILNRGARCATRGGAVSGAAQTVVSTLGERAGTAEKAIALSDGSRISFASIADAGILRQEDTRVLAPA